MQIRDVLSPGIEAFFYDDQPAIRTGVTQDDFIYVGKLTRPGFTCIRVFYELSLRLWRDVSVSYN
ncbi:hypothetical protein NKI48_32340 [Mesorhizobium sp. M0644]|uniref:hypothetical protein n=1 Tax=Mesorhizobium sp. M0644 TaxID=2956979 RepID=UPI003339CABB